MSTQDDSTPESMADPQTHLDTDPSNSGDDGRGDDTDTDTVDDPAHDAGEDEGWGSEGGATPTGPATDT